MCLLELPWCRRVVGWGGSSGGAVSVRVLLLSFSSYICFLLIFSYWMSLFRLPEHRMTEHQTFMSQFQRLRNIWVRVANWVLCAYRWALPHHVLILLSLGMRVPFFLVPIFGGDIRVCTHFVVAKTALSIVWCARVLTQLMQSLSLHYQSVTFLGSSWSSSKTLVRMMRAEVSWLITFQLS